MLSIGYAKTLGTRCENSHLTTYHVGTLQQAVCDVPGSEADRSASSSEKSEDDQYALLFYCEIGLESLILKTVGECK